MTKPKTKLPVQFTDQDRAEIVGSTLRRRDALIKHRTKCARLLFECPKCALLNLHERLADFQFAIRHARTARVPKEQLFREIFGVIAGGV